MQIRISLIAAMLALSSCTFIPIHKMDIEQGNIILPNKVEQLHLGMTKEQVTSIMGAPVLMNTFSENTLDYVYTFKPGHGQLQETAYTLTFKNGRLVNIDGNRYSQYLK